MVTAPRPESFTHTLTLTELVFRFLQSRQYISARTGKRLSPRTIEYYQMCLDGLLYFADQNDWPEPALVTRDHLREFMSYLSSEPHRWAGDGRRGTFKKASPGTVHHYLKVARTFFSWAKDEDYLKESPALQFRLPSPGYKEIEPYSDDEINAMLAICEHDIQRGNRYLGVRNKAIVSVFIDTGLRLTELADMRTTDLDPQLQQIRVLGKGAKFRVVPLSGEARRALKLYLTQFRQGGGDAVWQTDEGQPLSPYSIGIMIERLKKRAGVHSGGGAHRFRHYFATRYLENGGDMNDLRMLLGHATLSMVLRYTKFGRVRNLIDKHQEYSPLDHLARGGHYNQSQEGWGWRQLK